MVQISDDNAARYVNCKTQDTASTDSDHSLTSFCSNLFHECNFGLL